MNKLLVSIVLCIPLICYAVEPKEMYMPNDAGGFIVLTTELCQIEEAKKEYQYRAYSTEEPSKVIHEGCWTSPSTEDAPDVEGMKIIAVVNSWWDGHKATWLTTYFSSQKKRWSEQNTVKPTL